jgi:hypothetical protein
METKMEAKAGKQEELLLKMKADRQDDHEQMEGKWKQS